MIWQFKNNLRFILLTALILTDTLVAQNSTVLKMPVGKSFGQITGQVVDQKTGKPLVGVNIIVQGTSFGAATDNDGRFTIQKMPPGTYMIVASMIGYHQETMDGITVTAEHAVHVNFELKERVIPLKEVIVTPGHFSLMESGPRSSSGLGAADLRNFPQFGEDIYRAVSRLPGLASNDFSAKFYVRGGEQDEVLILLDGMELFDPFHLKDFGGALSVIDVELIREIDMISGAFPAEYGNRLSGVFNMKTRTPAIEKPKTSLALSFMNARLLSEGSFNKDKCRWQVLARRGYIDFILELIGEGDNYKPGYYDILGKLQYFLNKNHEISAHVLISHDKLKGAENDLPDSRNDELLNNNYSNSHGWLTWNAQFHSRLFAQTVLSVGSAFDDKLSQGYFNDILEYEASDKHKYYFFGLKQNWRYEATDRYLLKWGFDAKSYDAVYDYHYININLDQNNMYSRRDKNLDTDGAEFGLYLANRFRVSNAMTLELGMRYQYASWTGDNNCNPRVNVAYKLGDRTTLRTGWGIFNQIHSIDKLNMVDDDYTYYPAESSRHFMTGLEHVFLNGIHIRVEGYYKLLSDIRPRYISYRYNTDTSPENSHDRIRLEPERGKSRGIEVYLRKDNWGKFKWWLSYSYSLFENIIDGRNVPREMDQRHTINMDFSYQPVKKWAVNVSWHYHSGWPYTEETVNIISQNADGSYRWDWAPGTLYGKRFPAYHRMDLRVSRYFQLQNSRLSLFIEIRNLYNRKNIRQYEYSEVVIHSLDSYTFIKEPREWLPLIPSFGISWDF
jgi:outer membrane receptor for ferrienterochelin and colicin